jgi:drug/metabolite transporter (DMT)-like permease
MQNKTSNIFTKNYIILILALLSCLLWGSAFPSIKVGYRLFSIGTSDTFDKILFAGVRFFLASLMIFTFCIITKKPLKIEKTNFKKVLTLGVIQTAIQYFFFYIGLSNTSGTKGSILASTSTFFTVILAHFFYKEDKLTGRRVTGIILGIIGIILLNINGDGIQGKFTLIGDGFVIISSLMGAMAGIYIKRISKDISPFLISGYQLFTGSIFLILFGLFGGGQLISNITGYSLLIYLAFASAAAFSMWTVLLRYNGVGRISIFKSTIPVFGVFLSFIFLNERLLDINVLLSVVLVATSIMLITQQ